MDTNDLLDLRNAISQTIRAMENSNILNEGIMVDGSLAADIHAELGNNQVLITIKTLEDNYEDKH